MIIKSEDKEKNDKIYKLSMEIAKKNDEINALKRRIMNGERSHDQRLFEANVKLVNDLDILRKEINMLKQEKQTLVDLVEDTTKELEKVQKWLKDYHFPDYYPDLSKRIDKLKNWNGDEEDV